MCYVRLCAQCGDVEQHPRWHKYTYSIRNVHSQLNGISSFSDYKIEFGLLFSRGFNLISKCIMQSHREMNAIMMIIYGFAAKVIKIVINFIYILVEKATNVHSLWFVIFLSLDFRDWWCTFCCNFVCVHFLFFLFVIIWCEILSSASSWIRDVH